VVYAEGALRRARNSRADVRARAVEMPASDRPAARVTTLPSRVGPEAVLDPFAVGAKSLDVLAQELRALGRARLLNIISAYDLNRGSQNLQHLNDAQLITLIVAAVETAVVQSR